MEERSVQRTLVIIKPDGIKRHLIGEIISRFERKGLQLIAIKLVDPSPALISAHYAHLPDTVLPKVKEHMIDTVVAMIWRGVNAVKAGRQIIGSTKPLEAATGTIRGDFCMSVGRNLVHGSDSESSANKEINMWFPDFVEPEVITDSNIYEFN
ncbi:Nucleoside diphosphate kinase A [Cucumispora dikerogammari]|nr:Nucleoside diphosphate kinase A [Cucumispora dikerogammari]